MLPMLIGHLGAECNRRDTRPKIAFTKYEQIITASKHEALRVANKSYATQSIATYYHLGWAQPMEC